MLEQLSDAIITHTQSERVAHERAASDFLFHHLNGPLFRCTMPYKTLLNKTSFPPSFIPSFLSGQIELNATLSKLRYYPGYSPKDYVDPTFQPIFLDEVDMNKINSAITLCGGSTQKSCIYDYVLTGESTIALQTKTTQTESTANKLINGKN